MNDDRKRNIVINGYVNTDKKLRVKQSSTRTSHIEKWMPQILEGIGLHDKYGK